VRQPCATWLPDRSQTWESDPGLKEHPSTLSTSPISHSQTYPACIFWSCCCCLHVPAGVVAISAVGPSHLESHQTSMPRPIVPLVLSGLSISMATPPNPGCHANKIPRPRKCGVNLRQKTMASLLGFPRGPPAWMNGERSPVPPSRC